MTYEIVTKPHVNNDFISIVWQTDEKEERIHIFTFKVADSASEAFECVNKEVEQYIEKLKRIEAEASKMG